MQLAIQNSRLVQ